MLYKVTFLLSFLCCSLFAQNSSTLKPIFIFAHGIFDSKKKGEEYKEIIEGPVFSFDFDDALLFPYLHKPFTTCFAQDTEIKKLEKVYDAIIQYFESKKLPIPPLILVGLSRGSSTILNFLALKKPKYIKAVIVESPFDHIGHILEHILPNKSSLFLLFSKFLFSAIFPFYQKKGVQPVHVIKNISNDIAILFISSLQDQLVPHYHTMMLYHLLKQNGHKKTFIKIFDRGKHAKIVQNNVKAYKEVVREFLTLI